MAAVSPVLSSCTCALPRARSCACLICSENLLDPHSSQRLMAPYEHGTAGRQGTPRPRPLEIAHGTDARSHTKEHRGHRDSRANDRYGPEAVDVCVRVVRRSRAWCTSPLSRRRSDCERSGTAARGPQAAHATGLPRHHSHTEACATMDHCVRGVADAGVHGSLEESVLSDDDHLPCLKKDAAHATPRCALIVPRVFIRPHSSPPSPLPIHTL